MNNRSAFAGNILWVCLALYYVAIYVAKDLSAGSGLGKYIILGPIALLALNTVTFKRGNLQMRISSYNVYIFVFAAFCYLSSLWAIRPSYARNKAIDAFEVAIVMYLIYLCLPLCNNTISNLLKAWMWGGYIVVLYVTLRYGLDFWLKAAEDSLRVDNSVINANSLGMTASFAIVISMYFLLYDRYYLGIIAAIPSVLVVAVAQSRKSILILVLGIATLLILKNNGKLLSDKQNWVNTIRATVRSIIVLAVFAFLAYQISKLPMFEGVNSRIQGLINSFTGTGEVDSSAERRSEFIELGMMIFKEKSIFGIGIDNAKIYTIGLCGREKYLHCNYVELLADGGIIGFVLYYWFYLVLLIKFCKYRNLSSGEFCVVFIFFLLTLILDYGMVTYESKETYFHLLVFYLEADKLSSESITRPNRYGNRKWKGTCL